MKYPKLPRNPELDALRGLFLVWMTLAHLPTRFSDFVNQPIGFVSSAEGFVFLSALLVSHLYVRQAADDEVGLRSKLWKRALKIYGYHLVLLALAFTVAAGLAVATHRAALYNLLDFYFAHPFEAIIGSLLLLYTPPLLDILPMYVMFLVITPFVLSASVRWNWRWILIASTTIWVFAQFGLREHVHEFVVHATHLQIPLQETGAFNLFAWQAIWIAGLWLGATAIRGDMPLDRVSGSAVIACSAICLFFIGIRHELLGPHLTQQALGLKLDKWQIGPLRVINLVAFTVVVYWLRKYLKPIFSVEPFLTLGKASLEVFCAHIVFVFVGLALLYNDVPQLRGWPALGLLAITFSGLMLVAIREVKKRQLKKALAANAPASSNLPVPPTTQHFEATPLPACAYEGARPSDSNPEMYR